MIFSVLTLQVILCRTLVHPDCLGNNGHFHRLERGGLSEARSPRVQSRSAQGNSLRYPDGALGFPKPGPSLSPPPPFSAVCALNDISDLGHETLLSGSSCVHLSDERNWTKKSLRSVFLVASAHSLSPRAP